MQKNLIILFLIILLFSCAKDKSSVGITYTEEDYQQFIDLAWSDLSEQELSTVVIQMEEAIVKHAVISRENNIWYYSTKKHTKFAMSIPNPNVDFFNHQDFIAVIINTKDTDLLGPIVIIIEPYYKLVFSRGLRS